MEFATHIYSQDSLTRKKEPESSLLSPPSTLCQGLHPPRVLPRHNNRLPLCSCKSFLGHGRTVRPYYRANGHEETVSEINVSVSYTLCSRIRALYPNIVPDPSIYCPNVRITPLGPAPNLMMFVAPITPSVSA